MVQKLFIIVAVAFSAQLIHGGFFEESDFRGGLTEVFLGFEEKRFDPAFKPCIDAQTSTFFQEANKLEETIKDVSKKLSEVDKKLINDMTKLEACFTTIKTFAWTYLVSEKFSSALSKVEQYETFFRNYFENVNDAAAKNTSLKLYTRPLHISLSKWERYCKSLGEKVNQCITAKNARNS